MVNLPDAARARPELACASACPPPSRSRPRSCAAGRRRSASTSSTASARPRCCTSTAPTAPATSSPGTSGKPVPGLRAGRCSTSSAQPVADGEVGNLYVRGDSALAYYWHQHEKTKAAIKGDLFFTGDRYRVNDDGDYVYEGRADDMIKIGGLWASPDRDRERARRAPARARGGRGRRRRRLHDAREGVRHLPRRRGRRRARRRAAGVVQDAACAATSSRTSSTFVDELPEDADRQDPALQAAGGGMIFTAPPRAGLRRGRDGADRRVPARAGGGARRGADRLRALPGGPARPGGAPGAILANALLSGMRTLAAEGHAANAVAVGADADPEDLQHWIAQLEAGRGVAGELVRVHADARGQDPGMSGDRHRRRARDRPRGRRPARAPTTTCCASTSTRRVDGIVADVTERRGPRDGSSTPSTARSTCWSTTPASPATRGS